MTVILFLIVLAILIFVHELGHFLTARACGIRVDEFALGFGPRLWQKTKGETTYKLNLIPFGGYVKIFGENPDEASVDGPDSSRSLVCKPKWQQIAVLVAGVFFNFVFALILICGAFMIGVPASTESYPQYTDRMTNQHIAVTYIEPKSPAEIAGLKPGDEIRGYKSVEDVQTAIAGSKDKGIDILYVHGGVEMQKKIIGVEGIVEGKYAIGISMDNVGTLRLPIHLAIYEGVRYTLHMMKAITVGIYDLIAGIFDHTSKLSSVTGPIGIASMVRDAANLGFTYLMMFTALISINLGVLNLVPFPALDGGRILFVIIEAVIRRPIRPAVANTFNAIGFSLLMILLIAVSFKDVWKLFVK